MLTYFPMPYPGEWWYSVLCRYHVRSGNSKNQTTLRELFQGNPRVPIDSLLPNAAMRDILIQLPADIFDAKEMIVCHTLFPYWSRFYSFSKKQETLQRLILGETVTITNLRRSSELTSWSPRYCPQCVIDDRKKFGEAYWHIAHQVPAMRVCPQHGYKLQTFEQIKPAHMSSSFFPLEFFPVEGVEWEDKAGDAVELAQIMYEYQALPLEMGATTGYNNLGTLLSNLGYGVIQSQSSHVILDSKKLYHDLQMRYDPQLIQQVFGNENVIRTLNRMWKWEMLTPDRFAVMQHFSGLDMNQFFGKRLLEREETELRRLQAEGKMPTRKYVMEQLGVTPSQLTILAKRYGIDPFWRQTEQLTEQRKQYKKVFCLLDEEEHTLLRKTMKKEGYRYDSYFLRDFLLRHLQEAEKEINCEHHGQ